jgi:hypothetical protein
MEIKNAVCLSLTIGSKEFNLLPPVIFITLLLAIGKIMSVININWIWVLAPVWVTLIFGFTVVFILWYAQGGTFRLSTSWKDRKRRTWTWKK